jgi:hypothetical protein
VTPGRLDLTCEGQVRLAFRQPWRDGTTDVAFDPVEFWPENRNVPLAFKFPSLLQVYVALGMKFLSLRSRIKKPAAGTADIREESIYAC